MKVYRFRSIHKDVDTVYFYAWKAPDSKRRARATWGLYVDPRVNHSQWCQMNIDSLIWEEIVNDDL